jgi:hypothetical protein
MSDVRTRFKCGPKTAKSYGFPSGSCDAMANPDKDKWEITALEKTSEEEAQDRLRKAKVKLLACGLDEGAVRVDGSGKVVWVSLEFGAMIKMLGDGSEFYTSPSQLGSRE